MLIFALTCLLEAKNNIILTNWLYGGTFNIWVTVLIISNFESVLYGWTTGKPIGVIQPTGLFDSAISFAHEINHCLILWAPKNKFEIAFKVNLAT